MTRLDRLREIVIAGRRGTPGPVVAGARQIDAERFGYDVREVLGAFQAAQDSDGVDDPTLVVKRVYDGGHCYGRRTIDNHPRPSSQALRWLAGACEVIDDSQDPGATLYFDLETTGLSGGAGTVPFIVGFGWFDGQHFETHQYFLRHLGDERRMLDAVARVVRRARTLVTFNGRSFDVPVMEARYAFHRLESPFAELRHVDLLHPGRHLWRRDEARLVTFERDVLGVHRAGDVPGAEIPGRYVGYLRTADAQPLVPVMEHNRLDLVSLGLLTGVACTLVRGGATVTRGASQALGLGRVYEKVNQYERAMECYRRAAGLDRAGGAAYPQSIDRFADVDVEARAQALRRLASLYRRQRRHADAAEAWGRLLALPRVRDRLRHEATVALAVHHEHRLRDPLAARTHARAALEVVPTLERRRAVERRLWRLGRKIEASSLATPLRLPEAPRARPER